MQDNIPIEDNLFPIDFNNGIFHNDGTIIPNQGIIKDLYVCVRPANLKNVPKIKSTKVNNRIISTNYGHGGCGWSLLWGSVKKCIELTEKNITDNFNNNKIAIIGSGCVGSATILNLIEKGVKPENIQIFTKQMGDTTSHRSGAFLSTASVLDKIDPELDRLNTEINIESFKVWEAIERGEKFPKLREGTLKVKSYFGAEKEWGTIVTDSGLDIFVEHGLISEPELVKVKFNERYNLMRKYDSFYFNTFKLMKAFYDYILYDYQIRVNFIEVKEYSEIDESFDIVFDCSGLANQNLFNNDKDILPLAGHIVTLKGQDISKMNYVIYTHYIYEEDIGKYSYADAPLFYFMPKTDDKTFSGILGGSFVRNYHGGEKKIDDFEFHGVVRRTLEIFGEDVSKYLPKSKFS